jgi:molecular chaperone IbpA
MTNKFNMADLFIQALADNAELRGSPQTRALKTNEFPHYDIVSFDEGERVVISVAVAGFPVDNLSTVVENGVLVISGEKADTSESDERRGTLILHSGVAHRSFVKKFNLGEDLRVEGAWVTDGILNIELIKEIPESRRPKVIRIN